MTEDYQRNGARGLCCLKICGCCAMTGDGDFLSLGSHGSSSKSHGSEGCSGDGEEVLRNMLSSLSRNGLSMLAGGSNSGFSLKAPPVGSLASLRNLAMGGAASKVTGGGFTGFYRASANKSATVSARPSLLKMRLENEVNKEENGSCSRIVDNKDPLKTDVENLTPDECWRLILKLGSRWPAWNGTTLSSPAAPQGVMKDRGSTKDERVQGLQLGQDSLRLLATRALEALAQTPGRPASGGMLAPKEIAKTKAAAPILKAATKQQQPTLATVVQQPSLLAEVPDCSSREMAAPKAVTSSESRTAPLTIFYAGTVNVCDNVPEDKARLIMLFAEKAGISSNALQETAPSPSETLVRPQEEEELQVCSKPYSPSEVVLVTTSSAHQAEASSSDEKPACSSPQEIAEPSPVPLKITISEGKSRQQRQQGTAKPLPNARKNSLARFLDSRKRSTAPCSEGHPTKRPALGCDGCPSDAEDVKGTGKSPMQLCSQSSIDSKEGDEFNAEMLR